MNCVDSTLSFALRIKYTVFIHVKPWVRVANNWLVIVLLGWGITIHRALQLLWPEHMMKKARHNKTTHHLVRTIVIISAFNRNGVKLKEILAPIFHLLSPSSVPPLTSPFSSWTISTLRSVSLGSSSLKFSSFLQRTGIFASHVYIWDFYTSQGEMERADEKMKTGSITGYRAFKNSSKVALVTTIPLHKTYIIRGE